MISRGLKEAQVVGDAFVQKTFHSCTVSGFTSACGVADTGGALPFSHTGRIIDRLGLAQNYNSVLLAVHALGTVQASATSCTINYLGIALGIQHSSSTAASGFADYSTADWVAEQPLVRVSTSTSTGDGFYSAEAAFVSDFTSAAMTTSPSTSTSTGYADYVGGPAAVIPISGAKRFLRIVVAPHIETTGCGGSFMTVSGALVFGDGDKNPADSSPARARVILSSANTT